MPLGPVLHVRKLPLLICNVSIRFPIPFNLFSCVLFSRAFRLSFLKLRAGNNFLTKKSKSHPRPLPPLLVSVVWFSPTPRPDQSGSDRHRSMREGMRHHVLVTLRLDAPSKSLPKRRFRDAPCHGMGNFPSYTLWPDSSTVLTPTHRCRNFLFRVFWSSRILICPN